MKFYLAGKISGDPNYREKFERVADSFSSESVVLLPSILPEGMNRADYMRVCFAMMESADAVVFLPDWEESAGARVEHAWCEYTGKAHWYM